MRLTNTLSSQSRSFQWRSLWLQIHLYLGLFAGGVLVLIGLTGSVLVFYQEIDAFLNPALLTMQKSSPDSDLEGGRYQPFNEIVAAAKKTHPELQGPVSLYPPYGNSGTFRVQFNRPAGAEGQTEALSVYVDPVTGQVLGERVWGRHLLSTIYELHVTLLLGRTGRTTVGVMGLLLLISIGTGTYLWWQPFWSAPWKKLRQAFGFKRAASSARFHFELHKVSGIYSALVLIVIAFSGVYMMFPGYVKPVVNSFSSLTKEAEPKPIPQSVERTDRSRVQAISVEEAVAIADRVFPDAALSRIFFPEGPKMAYQVHKHQVGEVNKSHGRSRVWIDHGTGAVLAIRDPKKNTGGDTFLDWQFPLHNGEAFGLPGRIVILITGFIPLILYITGLKLWLQRRRSKKVSRERRRGGDGCG